MFSFMYGKIFVPGVLTAVPSAIVFALGSVITSPAFNEAFMQAAPAGSTPITLI